MYTSLYCGGRNIPMDVTKRSQIKTASHLHKTALTPQRRSQIKHGHYQIVMNCLPIQDKAFSID